MKSRFDGLPIHKLCYYQSYYPTNVTISRLKNIMSESEARPFNNQDCLGMAPLHILACSSEQNLDIYKFVVTIYPNSLITEDKWGCLPIFYAIWGGAPYDTMLFLINGQKATFPNYVLNWDKMVRTLCRAGASLNIIKRLLGTQQASFSDQSIDFGKKLPANYQFASWQSVATRAVFGGRTSLKIGRP